MRAESYVGDRYDGGIRTAVGEWFEDPAAAKARYGPIASWDTSGVTDMEELFSEGWTSGESDFNEDISRWDVSNVVTMRCMFFGATSFNGDLSRWNVSNVVDMHLMFYHATSFNCDLSCWEVGQVGYMSSMFHDATSFTHQLGGAWATSTADKREMFLDSPGTIAGKVKDAHGTIA